MKVLVVYYSLYGHTYQLARAVEKGVSSVQGAEAVFRRVEEFEAVLKATADSKHANEARQEQKEVPVCSLDDLREAQGVVLGSPTRYGNMTAQMKQLIDSTGSLWVNGVGVEVNTASRQLLTYVSGLGPQIAANIVAYRNEKGPFRSRTELKKVPRLGPKAFEQAAGFLRVREAENPLDASAVHPESYPIVDAMARDLNCSVRDLMRDPNLRKKIQLQKYVTPAAGLPTLNDILAELAKPGRAGIRVNDSRASSSKKGWKNWMICNRA